MISPSIENMYDKLHGQFNREFKDSIAKGYMNKIDLYDMKLSYNYGIEYKHFLGESNSISTGLFFVNKGYQKILETIGVDTTYNLIRVNTQYIEIPFVVNSHYKINKRSRAILSFGLHTGYLLSDKLVIFALQDDQEAKLNDGKTVERDLDLYNPFYIGGNIGLGISLYIKTKMILILQPNYTHQFNRAFKESANLRAETKAKYSSISFDVKIGYYFNRKLRNAKKKI
ncbi:outer membrane beta-barrel protein [Patescibacteria group bacterium]|nr:outer membrane beta-barrel protein [Patescibacteria group bacterium]